MKKVTLAMIMAFLLLLAACTGDDLAGTIEEVAEEVGEVADQVAENADEIAEEVEEVAEEAMETAEEVMASDLEELTVAYFLEWPTPNQFAQIEQLYDEALGIPVNWVSFDTGVAMSAAMASGDVQIAYSQGLVPFANAVSAGLDLQTVGIAVSYAENDNCVARTDLGITRDNVTDLHGQQVAVPIGTVAHYKMLKEMEYLGVDVAQLELVDLAPADGAAALQRGDVAMACGWGGGLARMKEAGNIIMTGAEMEAEIGLKVFDVVSVTGDFAKDHGDVITTFLQVTEDANAMFAKDPASMMSTIAEAAGMDMEGTEANLATFSFPTADEQLSDAWMGGTVQTFVKEVADFFVEQGELEAALDSYDPFINTSFLEQVESAPAMMADDAAMDDGAMADGSGMKVCQVTDVGGIDDKSFNATAWAGAQRAESELGVEIKFLESQQQTDYDKNLNAFIDDGCDLIIAVGFLMGDATAAAAEANPDQSFAIMDVDYLDFPNVLGIGFAIDEAGFLAGYTAANASETGIIGTFGGINIPPVTAFMDGYVMGANYYNEQTGSDVQVLGWDIDTQDGLFTGNFESTDDGRAFGESLMDEGADVIMPVAGPVGLGTAAAIQERGNAWLVGVDTDWTVSAPEFADIVLTSVLKRLDTAAFASSEATVKGTFEGGLWIGNLENEGVGLSESKIPADGLDAIVAGIIDGSIPTHPGDEAMMMDDGAMEMVDGSDTKVCQITDVGGIDDKSFNATAWLGVENAVEMFGIEGKFLESQQQTDYEKNIGAFIDDGCDLIVTVGFLLGDATAEAAQANPDQNFMILDFAYDPAFDNVQGVVFASNQNAFLAGYAAASVSETGIVGTYGGVNIPPVTDFMDGYVLGVNYFNEQNGTDVQVLGWDVDSADGLFTGNFESTDDGRAFAESLMDEGADVIFPLAGAANIGTASAVSERGGAWVIGVDSDFAAVLPEFADVIFMSTLKRLDTAVVSGTEEIIKGEFVGGTWVGTLENDGVGITDPTLEIPGLEDVREAIIAGDIVTVPSR